MSNGLRILDGILLDCDDVAPEIIVPKGVTHIGWHAFDNCGSAKNIILPNTVISIASCAFDNCDNLECLLIPSSVRFMPKDSFGRDTDRRYVISAPCGSYADQYKRIEYNSLKDWLAPSVRSGQFSKASYSYPESEIEAYIETKIIELGDQLAGFGIKLLSQVTSGADLSIVPFAKKGYAPPVYDSRWDYQIIASICALEDHNSSERNDYLFTRNVLEEMGQNVWNSLQKKDYPMIQLIVEQ